MTRPGQPVVGLTGRCAVHIAHDHRTETRIAEEAERLAWAARNGIPVPAVIEATTDWLITERAPSDGTTSGPGYVAAAKRAAAAIAAASEAPPSLRAPVPAHGGGRRAGLERLARILRSPLSPTEFRRSRTRAATLPRDTLAHGDFVLHNILYERSTDTVTIIDWEFLTRAPAHFDLLLLWPRLTDADDRASVLEGVLAATADRAATGVLHHWLCVRFLADLVTTSPPPRWDRPRIAAATDRLAESRLHAAQWA